MSGQTIIAPVYADPEPVGPLIFLAGPIQSAADWQTGALRRLRELDAVVHLASPRRPIPAGGDFAPDEYRRQVDWEHHYLDRAAADGVIMFWLAKEAKHDCGRAYAQTTRFELGEAMALHQAHGVKVVVGIESGFTNARYLTYTLGKKAPRIPLAVSLDELCRRAVELARK